MASGTDKSDSLVAQEKWYRAARWRLVSVLHTHNPILGFFVSPSL